MNNYKIEKNREEILMRIFYQKENNIRPVPSSNVILGKSKFSEDLRKKLLNMVAEVVDDNCYGRSDMCVYFAILIKDALESMGFMAKAIVGSATYYSPLGRFRGNEKSNPTIGEAGKYEEVEEEKIEVIVPREILEKVIRAMKKVHPYEEVAFDIYPIEN